MEDLLEFSLIHYSSPLVRYITNLLLNDLVLIYETLSHIVNLLISIKIYITVIINFFIIMKFL